VINADRRVAGAADETLVFWPGNASVTVLAASARLAGVLGLQMRS
jgi:hypothetical protein